MEERVKICLSDWQFNAGIVGLCNILEFAGQKYLVKNQHIEVTKDALINLNNNYLDYFKKTYEKVTNYYEVRNKLEWLLNSETNQETKTYKKYLEDINTKLNNAPYRSIRKKISKKQLANANNNILKDLDLMLIAAKCICQPKNGPYINRKLGQL